MSIELFSTHFYLLTILSYNTITAQSRNDFAVLVFHYNGADILKTPTGYCLYC